MKLLHLFILTLVLSISSFAQTSEFVQAKGSGTGSAGGFAQWNFEIGTNRYEIKEDGRGTRTSSSTVFKLPLAKGEIVDNVYFSAHKNDLIFVYGVSLGGDGRGAVASFNSTTLKLKWKANISGFNVGKGLIENRFAYLTAIGFVAKIDLTTGKYVWKHDDLYNRNKTNGAFNSFEVPELDNNSVIFTEKTYDNVINIIVADKTSGKITRTILDRK